MNYNKNYINKYNKYEWLVILISFLMAYILDQIPWPKEFIYYKPTCFILVLIYWIINLPKKINIGISFIIGIVTDFIKYTIIGTHALKYTILCYLITCINSYFYKITIWQQSLFIAIISILTDYIIYLTNFFLFNFFNYKIFYNSISNAIIWPYIFILLHKIRYKFLIKK